RVGILLRRNRIRLSGYRRRFLNGHHGDARLDLALRPVVPPEEESNLVLVVHGLYPEIVNAVDKVPRLVSDLSTHPDDPPRPILPFLVIGVRGNFSFDGSRRDDEICFRLSRLRIHLKQWREGIAFFFTLAHRIHKVGDVPPLLNCRVVGEGRHGCPVHTGGERSKNCLYPIRILSTPTEIPALVPVSRLDRETPVI